MSSQKAMINTLMFYHWDNTLFDTMSIPSSLARNDVVAAILEETSDFPVLITDLETLRFSIEKWSAHRVGIWEHLIATTQYEYNPIENYNRHETENTEMKRTGTGSIAKTGTGSLKGDGAEDRTVSTTARTGSDTNTESVSAFNESGFSNHTQNTTGYNSGSNVTDVRTNLAGTNETRNFNDTETRNFNDKFSRGMTIHGNIGVMSTQDMIKQEREIADFDIIDIIVTEFKKKFCILIY